MGDGYSWDELRYYLHTWKLLSPEGKKQFEKLLDEMNHDSFMDFKKFNLQED